MRFLPLLFPILLFSINPSGFAQTKTINNSFYLGRRIKSDPGINQSFRFSAELKSTSVDTNRNFTMQVRQVENDDNWVSSKTKRNSLPDTNWHDTFIESEVNSKTREFWLNIKVEGNGDFYVDNVRFQIRNNAGIWRDIAIPNADFEQSENNLLKGFIQYEQLPDGVTTKLVQRSDTLGKALQITATQSNIVWKTYYGNNTKIGRYIFLNGIKLYIEQYGKGEPLLLLHGNGQSIADFSKQIPDLATQYNVIAVDTRAQGKSSDVDNQSLSYDLFAEDMKILLDSLHIPKVHILGWSDGGNTGLTMAIKYPDYVSKLMIMGANLNPTSDAVENSMLRTVEKDHKKLSVKKDAESKRVAKLLTLLLSAPNISTMDLRQIRAKTLVMAGEKDIIKPAHTKLIAENIRDAKLLIFDRATHMAPAEIPNIFNQAILQFLKFKNY